MPRHRPQKASTSSESNMNCDQSESLNLSDELPDPGLPKANGKEPKEKKRVSFNFPVEVKTNEGTFTGMGIINLSKSSSTTDQTSKPGKAKDNNIVYDLTQDTNDKKNNAPKMKPHSKSQDRGKAQESAKAQDHKKTQEPAKVQGLTKTQEPSRIHDLTKNQELKAIQGLTKVQGTAKAQETSRNMEMSKTKQQSKKPASAPLVESLHGKNKEEPTKKLTIKEMREAKRREEEALREAIKKSIEEENRAKAQFEEFNKIYKPTECLKYMTIEVHPHLAKSWYMSELFGDAVAAGVRVVTADDICDPGLLTWSRYVPSVIGREGGQMKLAPAKQPCGRAFYVTPAEGVVSMLAAGEARARLAHKQALAGVRLTVVIFGVAKVINGMSVDEGNARMSGDTFGKAFSDLQMQLMVEHKIEILMVDTPRELGHLVLHYTKSIAEAPYKIAKRDIDEQAEFYMRGDNKNCVVVDKDGNGLSRLWEQMIAVLPMSSLEIARSLGAEYKTPRALLQEFQTTDGVTKIADIRVARTNVPGAKTRRLGPEFARKLYTLFTTEDGNTVIE